LTNNERQFKIDNNFQGKKRGAMQQSEGKDKKKDTVDELREKVALIGPSLFLKGELSGEEALLIEGNFQGKIELRNHDLIVAQGAKVEAEIRARNITIHGDVSGNIYASEKVFISEHGQMKGDICASKISIVDGALFKGSVKMVDKKEKNSSDSNP
jgi:cytoskeletal protein CcmA (bactofilin family)